MHSPLPTQDCHLKVRKDPAAAHSFLCASSDIEQSIAREQLQAGSTPTRHENRQLLDQASVLRME